MWGRLIGGPELLLHGAREPLELPVLARIGAKEDVWIVKHHTCGLDSSRFASQSFMLACNMQIDLDEAAKQLPHDILHQLYKQVYAYHIALQKAKWSNVHTELLERRPRTPSIQDIQAGIYMHYYNIFRIMSGMGGRCYAN